MTPFLSKRLGIILATGQIISVLLALTGFISTNLTERGFIFPVLQSTGFYFLMSLSLVSWPFPTKMPVLLYVLLALFDVEANYLAVKAYQYTDITSILLLNSLTIPWIVILSFFVLKRRYTARQIIALVVCLVGLGFVVGSDTLRGRWGPQESGGTAWIGDVICVGSSFLYACQNVLQEYMLKRIDSHGEGSKSEYMGMLGLCGFIISNIQWISLERSGIFHAGRGLWTGEIMGLFTGFSLTMVSLYLLLTWFIGKYDASLFNMNILTSGIYGIIFEIAQGQSEVRFTSDWMYLTAYILIVIGVIMYSTSEGVPSSNIASLAEPLALDKDGGTPSK